MFILLGLNIIKMNNDIKELYYINFGNMLMSKFIDIDVELLCIKININPTKINKNKLLLKRIIERRVIK